MGQTALPPFRRKARWGFFSPWKIRQLRPGLKPRTWVPKASTVPLDHRSRFKKMLLYFILHTPTAVAACGHQFVLIWILSHSRLWWTSSASKQEGRMTYPSHGNRKPVETVGSLIGDHSNWWLMMRMCVCVWGGGFVKRQLSGIFVRTPDGRGCVWSD